MPTKKKTLSDLAARPAKRPRRQPANLEALAAKQLQTVRTPARRSAILPGEIKGAIDALTTRAEDGSVLTLPRVKDVAERIGCSPAVLSCRLSALRKQGKADGLYFRGDAALANRAELHRQEEQAKVGLLTRAAYGDASVVEEASASPAVTHAQFRDADGKVQRIPLTAEPASANQTEREVARALQQAPELADLSLGWWDAVFIARVCLQVIGKPAAEVRVELPVSLTLHRVAGLSADGVPLYRVESK